MAFLPPASCPIHWISKKEESWNVQLSILYTQGMQVTPKDVKTSELGCAWYLELKWASNRISFSKMLAIHEIFCGAARV